MYPLNGSERAKAELVCAGLASAWEFANDRPVPLREIAAATLTTPVPAEDLERGKELFALLCASEKFPPVETEAS